MLLSRFHSSACGSLVQKPVKRKDNDAARPLCHFPTFHQRTSRLSVFENKKTSFCILLFLCSGFGIPSPQANRRNCILTLHHMVQTVPERGIKAFFMWIRTTDFKSLAIMLCTLPAELPFSREGFEPSTPQFFLTPR